jgi:hypothetical protein
MSSCARIVAVVPMVTVTLTHSPSAEFSRARQACHHPARLLVSHFYDNTYLLRITLRNNACPSSATVH